MFMFRCFALDKDKRISAWGTDTTKEKAKQRCLLALDKMVDKVHTFTFHKVKD